MEPIDHRRVLRVAVPIVLSNATVPLLGLVNTGVVGQLGQAAPIGAVGIGAVILVSLYWIFGFLRMGTTGLVAQAKGQGDPREGAAVLMRALLIAFAAGLGLVLLQGPLFWGAFRIAPTSDEVEALARSYLSIRIWGAPATIALYALTGWLIALERTRAVLVLQLWMNGLNVVLDLGFVLGLGWGVPGVAAATLIAEYAGLALALWFVREAFFARPGRAAIFDRTRLLRMARVNTDIMIRSVLLQGCFTAFLFLGAGEGDIALAANQVLLQFLEITAYALDGFAFAAETLVGQAVGARDPRGVRRAAIVASRWGAGGALALSLVFMLAGPALIDLMASAPEVRETARHYLPWLWLMPMVSVAGYMFDGIFVGATLTREMRNAVALSVAVYAVVLAIALPLFGNHGLWAALTALNTARGLSMARLYPRAEAKAA
ncbi:MATE family efflux transporter [Sinirhodobacter populi]|uniref:MATE family efflux transporter n=1 Tax=Paenirhodobacter populi TaxID=2306993 RepID=A0A443KF22_9RHOB|nr:MATE family efflux transporter [Sinirhodobacter populi]RWR31427.1 MATE family efflux transporter [Sinirhodobacter populi]